MKTFSHVDYSHYSGLGGVFDTLTSGISDILNAVSPIVSAQAAQDVAQTQLQTAQAQAAAARQAASAPSPGMFGFGKTADVFILGGAALMIYALLRRK